MSGIIMAAGATLAGLSVAVGTLRMAAVQPGSMAEMGVQQTRINKQSFAGIALGLALMAVAPTQPDASPTPQANTALTLG